MMSAWVSAAQGVLALPSGRVVRGRALCRPLPDGVEPEFAVSLLRTRPVPVRREARWIRWPDFRLPTDHHDVQDALHAVWSRATHQRVETPWQRRYVSRLATS